VPRVRRVRARARRETEEITMPKVKTKRAARKRVKMTGTGKLRRAGAWKQHKLEAKSPKRRRKLRQSQPIAKADEKRIRKLVPYL
jgi:large subunit ribosomal protein L35